MLKQKGCATSFGVRTYSTSRDSVCLWFTDYRDYMTRSTRRFSRHCLAKARVPHALFTLAFLSVSHLSPTPSFMPCIPPLHSPAKSARAAEARARTIHARRGRRGGCCPTQRATAQAAQHAGPAESTSTQLRARQQRSASAKVINWLHIRIDGISSFRSAANAMRSSNQHASGHQFALPARAHTVGVRRSAGLAHRRAATDQPREAGLAEQSPRRARAVRLTRRWKWQRDSHASNSDDLDAPSICVGPGKEDNRRKSESAPQANQPALWR